MVNLRKINNGLSVIAALLAIYVIGFPYFPEAGWWVKHSAPFHPSQSSIIVPPPASDKKAGRPASNTLIIPSIDMKQEILDGPTAAVLDQGLWHRPATSSPVQGGNTVIAGHRFSYRAAAHGQGAFYFLDKINIGDSITVYWQQQRYDYEVTAKLEVAPTTIEIEKNTAQPNLTLYTCTPLWSASNRLVVQAKLTQHTI